MSIQGDFYQFLFHQILHTKFHLMVADPSVRYYSRTIISKNCRFCEILHQIHNILWLHITQCIKPENKRLQILWDITLNPQYVLLSFLFFLSFGANFYAFYKYHQQKSISKEFNFASYKTFDIAESVTSFNFYLFSHHEEWGWLFELLLLGSAL